MALDREHFIQIPGTQTTISPTQEFNGFNYDRTHFRLAENGVYIPISFEFSTHRNNVIMAYRGESELKYATGEKVPKPKVKEIYHALLNDCWIWLNGRFVKGSGFNGLDLETVVDVEDKKLVTKKEPLEKCVNENCYVDLKFNNQGFPTKIFSKQKFIREKNVSYAPPMEDCVARFLADSDRACLVCLRDPLCSDGALGVFPCAEGMQKISETFSLKEIEKGLKKKGFSGAFPPLSEHLKYERKLA